MSGIHLPLHIPYYLDIVIVVYCWVSTAEYLHTVLKIKACKSSVWIVMKTFKVIFCNRVHLECVPKPPTS